MIERAHTVLANDGVRLDTSVCLPHGPSPEGGWPCQILVHGHGEDGSKATTLERGRRAAGMGYAAVCFSVRGQGGSDGLSFHLGAQELFDLQEVVAWAARALPIGRIAVCGASQGGWHAWMAAAHCPQVTTVVPEHIFVDFAEFAVPEGALSTWFFTRTMRRRVLSAGLQDLARTWAIDGDWDRLRTWLRPMSPRNFAHRIRCPVLVVHGWHDVGMPANDLLEMFAALQVPRRLVLGGGGHDGPDAEAAAELRTDLVDRWLAHWLRDEDTGVLDGPPLLFARRPGWDHIAAEHLDGDATTTHYLRHGGTLADTPPERPTPNSNINHVPRDPAYTLATALHTDLDGTAEAWPREEAAFDGPPLAQALELRGIPRFELHTLPSRPFFQVHAELYDVAPDGAATLITRAHRGARDAVPGAHLQLELETRAIAYVVPAGHRLRVVVADQRPEYVVPVYRPWRARLFHEPGRVSRVILPCVG